MLFSKTSNRPLKWGIIGGGIVSQKTKQLYIVPNKSKITAIFRRDKEKSKEFADSVGAQAYSSKEEFSMDDIDKMLKDKHIDAVYLSMIPATHRKIAKRCCKAKKPLYIEKMFTMNYSEAKELVDMYEQENLPLLVAHFCRCLPQIEQVKKLINQNKIGIIKKIDMNVSRKYNELALETKKWMQDPNLAGGGWFADLGPHYLDTLISLFGDIQVKDSTVLKTFKNNDYRLEDYVDMNFKTSDGIKGTATFDFNSDSWRDEVNIEGEDGCIKFQVLGRGPVIIIDKDGNEQTINIEHDELLQATMVDRVIDFLRDENTQSQTVEEKEQRAKEMGLCTGKEALKSSRIIDNVLSRFYENRSFTNSSGNPHKDFLNGISVKGGLLPRTISVPAAKEPNQELEH